MMTHAVVAILVVASHFGLSAAVAAGGTSKDTWKGHVEIRNRPRSARRL